MNLSNILFIDIETVRSHKDFEQTSIEYQELWQKKNKFQNFATREEYIDYYYERGGILSEFGKIVCISLGFYYTHNNNFKLKSFVNVDEVELLKEFQGFIDKITSKGKSYYLCGHNIFEFDIPYICRRMLIQGLKIPKLIDTQGQKPWEIKHIDTMQLWKFGDYKNYTSLELLAYVFGLNTSKDDIDGSMVGDVFWNDNDLEKIRVYCEKDVILVFEVYCKLKLISIKDFKII